MVQKKFTRYRKTKAHEVIGLQDSTNRDSFNQSLVNGSKFLILIYVLIMVPESKKKWYKIVPKNQYLVFFAITDNLFYDNFWWMDFLENTCLQLEQLKWDCLQPNLNTQNLETLVRLIKMKSIILHLSCLETDNLSTFVTIVTSS